MLMYTHRIIIVIVSFRAQYRVPFIQLTKYARQVTTLSIAQFFIEYHKGAISPHQQYVYASASVVRSK